MLDPVDVDFMLHEAGRMLGRPYLLGAKWPLDAQDPVGPIDCSGFVRWVYSRGGLSLPDGSYNQVNMCKPVANKDAEPGDLAFFKAGNGTIDHVGIVYDAHLMIEARGNPYNEVITRPRSKWEAYELFAGYFTYTGK